MLDLTVNRDSKPPLYRQIAEQIKTQISNGRLPANSRLPTVRGLARSLGVTRLTVQNAYAELQADGWVEATVGRGTFVSTAVRWSEPQGGFSCWVTLPRRLPPGLLYRQALENGFAFTPGEAYMMEDTSHEYLRLCFGNLSAEGIEAGVKLLSALIQQQLDNGQSRGDWLPYV